MTDTATPLFTENKYRSIMVNVDSYDKQNMRGRIYHPCYPQGQPFENLMQLILAVQNLCDDMDYPQTYMESRTFWDQHRAKRTPQPISDEPLNAVHGRQANFILKVLFRQNASWQGTLYWLDQNREESFRSVLELLLLFNEALADK